MLPMHMQHQSHALSLNLRPWLKMLGVIVLLLLAVTLMLLSTHQPENTDGLRGGINDTLSPVMSLFSKPAEAAEQVGSGIGGYIDAVDENKRLRESNDRLLQWESVARQLMAENEQLLAQLKLENALPRFHHIHARIISQPNKPLAHFSLINKGRRDGIETGYAALVPEGVIGRIWNVHEHSARLLLLSDARSRIPVMSETRGARAMLSGRGQQTPILAYTGHKGGFFVGERLVTSGDGDTLPAGLPVGTIAAISEGLVTVTPYADMASLKLLSVAAPKETEQSAHE